MSSELKACPFCGGIAWDGASSMRVYCQECYAQVKQEISEGHDVVVARWNRRSPSPAVMALVEAAKQHHQCATLRSDGTCAGCNLSEALAGVEHEIGDQFADASKKVEGGSDAHR